MACGSGIGSGAITVGACNTGGLGRDAGGHRVDPSAASRDHRDPGDVLSVPPPLTAIADAVRPWAAEEARTIAASSNTGTLATLTVDGDPWASFVTYGLLGGAPVRIKDLNRRTRRLMPPSP
jgi:hypothetical protein